MSKYSREGRGGNESGNRHSEDDYQSERKTGHRDDSNRDHSGQNRSNPDHRSRDDTRGYGTSSSSHRSHDNHQETRGDGASSGYNRRRDDHQSSNSDGYGTSGDNQLETQRDTIFIQNLPRDVTATQLEDVFKQIGVIKIDKKTGNAKIWIYKDKTTGEGKGEATVTYEDEEAAQAAITWYDGKELLGNTVKISLATRRASSFGGRGFRSRGGFRGRGGFGGGDFGGYRGRGGDRGGDYRGGGRGASHGFGRDHRTNPY